MLDRVQQRVEWTQYQDRQRRKVEAKEEKERGSSEFSVTVIYQTKGTVHKCLTEIKINRRLSL